MSTKLSKSESKHESKFTKNYCISLPTFNILTMVMNIVKPCLAKLAFSWLSLCQVKVYKP